MSPAAFFESTAKKLFWKGLGPKASAAGPFRLKPGMSVLALRPDRLGDFLLSTPALQFLESQLGATGRLTVVAGERNASIAKFLFPRAEILVFRKNFLSRIALFLRLKTRRYDLVVDFHSYPFSTTSAILALGPGCSRRVGFWDAGKSREASRRVFNLGVPPPGENLHEMEKSLLLLKPLGLNPHKSAEIRLSLPNVGKGIRNRVQVFYDRIGVGPKTFVLALHPTLLKVDNRWSLEHYAHVVRKAAFFPGVKILLVHGLGEEDRLQRFKGLCAKIPNLFALPENDVLFILEAAKRFELFVCNDSGLMHLAALVTRVLAVFGPSEPSRWAPLKAGNLKPKILRSKDCQCDSVPPGEVLKEIEKALRHSRQKRQ